MISSREETVLLVKTFTEMTPTLENFWRSIILFGRNVASYKFALGKSLLELTDQGGYEVSLDELAVPFARHVSEHLKLADKQGTSARSLPWHVLAVAYEPDSELLVVERGRVRRRPITGARDALNGYQKGRCFYCRRAIEAEHADVDHFLPHTMLPFDVVPNIDGIWNLVLACADCNRGPKGKFARVSELRFLEGLHDRNEFLIVSHHPLRETLMLQTGATEPDRRSYLQKAWTEARNILIHT